MPIKHSGSQKAFESNLRRELERGKPMKQALAIAYSVQREAEAVIGGIIALATIVWSIKSKKAAAAPKAE